MRAIRHFRNLDERVRRDLFSVAPEAVPLDSPAPSVGAALGAVVYVPAARPDLPGDLARLRACGAEAVVIDLEDSVPVEDRAALLAHVDAALQQIQLHRSPSAIFLRPADAEALRTFATLSAGGADHLTGVVLPKVSRANLSDFFRALSALQNEWGRRILSMPVLEAPAIADVRTRVAELAALHGEIQDHAGSVAAVRIGAADLGSAFGIRRDGEHTVYDIAPIAAAIGDIVSTFSGVGNSPVPISGPVWEHFSSRARDAGVESFSTQVEPMSRRVGPLSARRGPDAMISEIRLDRANGLVGKTVIHPSHVGVVHALHAVEGDEYADALDIVASGPGGVSRARGLGRMNENSPHRAWAQRTLSRARTFGVLEAGVGYADVLGADQECA